jgi:hypothetical protein
MTSEVVENTGESNFGEAQRKFTLYLNDNTMEELLVAVAWG